MKKWTVNVNGQDNEVVYIPNAWSGKNKLVVNGQEQIVRASIKNVLNGVDIPLDIDGKECHFVLIGGKAGLAVDGTYLDSKKPYAPLKPSPKWAWIFFILCLAIPVVSLGGALPVMLGIAGAFVCARICASQNMKTGAKVICCILVTLLAWAGLAAVVLATSGVQEIASTSSV